MKYPILFALLTALFWGMYGPAVGQARALDPDRPPNAFKPYILIGVAYLIWGIIGGYIGMMMTAKSYAFTFDSSLWGFIGGTLGAFGALALTLAIFSGGKPLFVMPIVFGGAVSVTAIVSFITASEHRTFNPWLWAGIAGTAVCIVVVAYNTPHATPHKAPPAQTKVSDTPS